MNLLRWERHLGIKVGFTLPALVAMLLVLCALPGRAWAQEVVVATVNNGHMLTLQIGRAHV